jgi:hypothetical protein
MRAWSGWNYAHLVKYEPDFGASKIRQNDSCSRILEFV